MKPEHKFQIGQLVQISKAAYGQVRVDEYGYGTVIDRKTHTSKRSGNLRFDETKQVYVESNRSKCKDGFEKIDTYLVLFPNAMLCSWHDDSKGSKLFYFHDSQLEIAHV